MAAIVVASNSTGVGLGPCSSSPAARLPQQQKQQQQQQQHKVSLPWRMRAVQMTLAQSSRSRGSSSFPVMRNALAENPTPRKHEPYTVGDYMTPMEELFCATENTTINEALEVLVEKRITGMPVIDDSGALVGVVSDYDLLALDSISGQREPETSLFPEAGRTWKAFKEIQKLLIKTNGKTVGDVMTPSPLVVREQTNLEDAAKVLLDTKFRRLPVVDQGGKLVGLLTRGNVVRAALMMKRAAEEVLGEEKAAENILKSNP